MSKVNVLQQMKARLKRNDPPASNANLSDDGTQQSEHATDGSNTDSGDSPYDQLDHDQSSLATNPKFRMAFWTGCVVVVTAGIFYGWKNVDWSPTSAASVQDDEKVTEPAKDKAIKDDLTGARISLSDQDVEQNNARALLEAEERAREFNKTQTKANQTVANPATPRPASSNSPSPRISSPRPVAARNTVRVPRTISRPPVQRPASTSSRTAYTPRPAIPRVNPSPSPKPSAIAAPKPTPANPYEVYAQMDNIGSYGQANWGNKQNGRSNQIASNGSSTRLFDPNFAGPVPGSPTASNAGNNFVPTSNGFDPDTQEVYMSPGESLELSLQLPIFWSSNRPPQKTIATVTKGTKYLPAGTRLTVLASGDTSGLVQVSQLEIVDGQEMIPLYGSMQITKADGKPLKAKKKGGPGFFKSAGIKALLSIGGSIASSALGSGDVTVNNGSASVTQGGNGLLGNALKDGTGILNDQAQQVSDAAIDRQKGQEYFVVEPGQVIKVSAVSSVGG